MEPSNSPVTPEQPESQPAPRPQSPPSLPSRWRTLVMVVLLGGAIAWVGHRFQHGSSGRLNSRLEWQSDVNAALSVARRKNLPVLMIFTSDGCVHCRRVQDDVLGAPAFDEAADGRVVPALLNISEPRHRQLLAEFGSRFVPTIVLTDSRGEKLAMFSDDPQTLPDWVVAKTNELRAAPTTRPTTHPSDRA